MKHDTAEDEVFDMEELMADVWGRDRQLAQAALFATGELKRLVDLRAAEDGMGIEATWAGITDAAKLRAEIGGKECERRRAALRVTTELDHLRKLRAISRGERSPLSADELRRWADRVVQSLQRLKPITQAKRGRAPRARVASAAS